MKRSRLSPGHKASCSGNVRLSFPTTFCLFPVVKWTRGGRALAVEASRTVGDALMQLPRHCRVSPPAPTYTTTNTTTVTQAGASTASLSLSLSHQQPEEPGAFTLTRQQRSSRRRCFGFIYLCRATWELS